MLIIRLVLLIAISVLVTVANAAAVKDPTRPILFKAATNSAAQLSTASKLSLSVIKLEKNHKVAIINNRVYQQGQRIGKDTIIKILLDKVIFSSGKELYLFGHSVVSVSE